MAATLVGVSTLVFGTSAGQPSAPAGYANDDVAYYLWISKPTTSVPATPSGWSLVSNYIANSGGTETGNQGPMRHMIWKTTVSGTLTPPSVSNNIGNAASQVTGTACAVYRPGAGETISETAYTGQDVDGGTARSITFTTPDLDPGDQLLLLSGNADNATTIATPSLTSTGVTFGTITEQADASTGNGDDLGVYIHTSSVSSGSATGNATFAATLSTGVALQSVGGTTLLRVRGTVTSTPVRRLFQPF
jgi:hypothetical protein